MSLTLSPELSARVLACAEVAGMTAEEFLDEAIATWEALEAPPAVDPAELPRM